MNEASAGGIPIDRREVVEIISRIVRQVRGAPQNVDENTHLFGTDGFLDSLRLISVVLDTEQEMNDKYGLAISLADNPAVSRERSPYRSVGSFADYILMVAAGEARA